MTSSPRTVVGIAWLAAVIIIGALIATGIPDHVPYLQAGNGASPAVPGFDQPTTRNVFTTYRDDETARAEARGVAGFLVRYHVAVYVVVAFAAVFGALWMLRSASPLRDGERRLE